MHHDGHSQLFIDLPAQRVDGHFATVHVPAGQCPQALARVDAAANEQEAVVVLDASNHGHLGIVMLHETAAGAGA